VGEVDGQPYIVMEYVQGHTLERLIREKRPVTLPERVRLLRDLCAGVAFAHEFDVIHWEANAIGTALAEIGAQIEADPQLRGWVPIASTQVGDSGGKGARTVF